jgi:hypothetical protein
MTTALASAPTCTSCEIDFTIVVFNLRFSVGVNGIQCMFTTLPPQNVDVSKSVNRRFVVCKSDYGCGYNGGCNSS